MTKNTETPSTDLLVIGGGPTGLAAAVDALRHGLTVRIIERRAERAEYSKALVVHARTMEVFERLGCAEAVLKLGARFRALHVHTIPGRERTRVDLLDLRWGDTRYPHWLSVPQYEVERALEARLAESGAHLEWSTELVALEQRASDVVATLRGPDGGEQRHVARWVLGCDGGRSTTRDLIHVTMQRTELGVTFALADVMTDSELVGDEGHVIVADEGLLLIVPMPAEGVWRLIAQVDDATPELDATSWGALVTRRSGIDLKVRSMGWNSRFKLASGVSETLRRGRVFLLGDAAHVHSPVGGQGLNTGVQDAHNLIWKLALVDRAELPVEKREPLLDSYATERHAAAEAMVRGTERMTRLLTGRRRFVFGALRRLAPVALRFDRVRDRLGRGVGMLDLRTEGRARLANPELAPGVRLHDKITSLHPTLLRWNGQELLVRPDLVVANRGELPHLCEVRVEGPGSAS